MITRVKVEGLKELDKALAELPKSTGKAVLRRVLKKAGQPMADTAERLAPEHDGHLKRSIGVSTKLTKRQKKEHRKMFRSDKASVEMFVGAGGLPQAHIQEFGSEKILTPQPFMRPAWDQHQDEALNIIKSSLGDEITKAAARRARKAARLAAKGK